VGLATNFADVYTFMHFLESFVDKSETDIQDVEVEYTVYPTIRDNP